ncbi:MAG: hypothetical protein K9G48_08980 [Reyranella sp.]|nr:hypothetical protein [Reyranella sp.]
MTALTEARDTRVGLVTNLVESGALGATGQSPWLPLEGAGEHVFTADIDDLGAATGTFVIEARRTYRDGATTGVTKTIFSSAALADFPQVGRLTGWWEVRLRCAAFGAGSFNLAISQ